MAINFEIIKEKLRILGITKDEAAKMANMNRNKFYEIQSGKKQFDVNELSGILKGLSLDILDVWVLF